MLQINSESNQTILRNLCTEFVIDIVQLRHISTLLLSQALLLSQVIFSKDKVQITRIIQLRHVSEFLTNVMDTK